MRERSQLITQKNKALLVSDQGQIGRLSELSPPYEPYRQVSSLTEAEGLESDRFSAGLKHSGEGAPRASASMDDYSNDPVADSFGTNGRSDSTTAAN